MTEFSAEERKKRPLFEGLLKYFPDALLEVAYVSYIGNKQHNGDAPLHWDKSKSTDHADSLMRHLVDRGALDTDGCRHSAKVAWRALALLQTELEREVKQRQQFQNFPSDYILSFKPVDNDSFFK